MKLLPRLLAVAAVAAAALGAAGPPPVFEPDPSQPGAGTLQAETWSRSSDTAALWLTRIDEATRTRFVTRRSGLDFDPFSTAPGHHGGFVTFHVLVENHTAEQLVFQPQSCWLHTNTKDMQRPLDLPAILEAYDMADRPAPPNIDRVRAAILDGEVVLGPGQQRDGLMVFRAFDPKAKRFQVDMAATVSRGEPLAFSAFYKRKKQAD